jgi:hypothetical protein
MSRDLARQRVDTLQRWLRRNDMALIDTTTGQPPGLIAYRLESLMDELADDDSFSIDVESERGRNFARRRLNALARRADLAVLGDLNSP